MNWFIFGILALALAHNVHSMRLKTIEKRAICSNNRCNNGCDGRTCNTCNNNVCCSSVNCNSCVNECTNNCDTASCKNNCVSGCSTSCQEPTCAVSSCSQCVNKCSNTCSTNNCVNDCSRSCNCKTREQNEPIVLLPQSQGSDVIVNNSNVNLVNLTTNINIENTIHNINNISVPVHVNTTNINNINLTNQRQTSQTRGGSSRPQVIPIPIPQPFPIQAPRESCCRQSCYQDTCYNDCSRGCGQETSDCQFVSSWPYVQCGNYGGGDCSSCYTCRGGYSPNECFRRNRCPYYCRRERERTCVPSQYGPVCF